MKIKNVKFLKCFGINGIVLYPFILFADRSPSPKIETHEDIHWQQVKRDGFFGFYLRYLWEYFRYRRQGLDHDSAYRAISYEQEAFQNQTFTGYKIPDKKKQTIS